MSYSYCVLGAGRQGVAAAYDLIRFGDARRVTLCDADAERAHAGADRVNSLLDTNVASGIGVDVRDGSAVHRAILGCDVVASAVPYHLNYELTGVAIDSGVSFCDLGGNTDIVRRQHALDNAARTAGVRVVPDCGMGPGMGNNLAVRGMELLDEAEHVCLFDGGIPRAPKDPWNYVLSFSIEGLANEYYGGITILRNGELEHVPCFTELEYIDFPPIGRLEAFFVAGGCSTAPWTFQHRVKTYQLKILRYPGTFAQLKAFSDLGLFAPEKVRIGGVEVTPRQVFCALYEPQIRQDVTADVCLIRAQVSGTKNGRRATAVIDLVDYHDPATGFSSMERTTGWHLGIVAGMLARGETAVGALPLESAVSGARIVEEARKRGFEVTESVR